MAEIPEWFKIVYTVLVVAFMIIYWPRHGPANFLWFSDVAFIGAVPAMWLESGLLAGVLACMALLPEILWNVDYASRLLLRRRITGLTEYMFDPSIPRWLRTVSLFHVPLPLVLVWLVAAYGYPPESLFWSVIAGAVILALSRIFSSKEKNINWVFGPAMVQHRVRPATYLLLLYLSFLLLVFVPTHLVLLRLF
ncbi:membrane-associated protein [Thioalkalivibrio sp. XN8]|uniref:membrane-associated protein n=1 Tax=Thioalkalivibrio sp. XN8 TaxID=2712863 RepID=UPI0013E9BF4C|nr:membrane-associated protein [Thioalkalivibrio sp. XN8]NGP52278.1 membrane-associated protein [Thioalkalivibrio sp. XN8]